MSPELRPFIRPRFAWIKRLFPHLVFWCWNAVFLSVAAFGITPLVTAGLVAEMFGDLRIWSIVLAALLVIAVPLAATVIGALALRRDPVRLFRLFYAVEAPLFVLALGRLFLVRDLTPGVAYVIVTSVLAVSAYVYRLMRNAEETRPAAVLLALAGDTAGVWVAGYAAVLLLFFAVPLAWASVSAFARFHWLGDVFRTLPFSPLAGLFILLAGILLLSSGTLFGLLPPVLVVLYARRFRTGARWAASRLGVARTIAAVTAVSTVLAGGFLASVRQPQVAAFAALAAPPAGDDARRARLAAAGDLRDGLVNAYLAPFRYLGSTADANAVRQLWHDALDVGTPGQERVQHAFNAVAAPFLYEGEMGSRHSDEAAVAYKGFFDRSIQRGERETVVAAVEATWSREEREAGLLAQGERKVHVDAQEVRLVDTHDDLAEIEIHEVYQNRTTDPQEVVYYFSLPETAALTGLWLGETDDRGAAFAFTISPRGAAQRVYRGEVQRRRDPALLEQVGPRQYRLRAFPVPARTPEARRGRDMPTFVPDRPLHLWMRYRAIAEGGAFPLPHLLEERNAFRDRATRRTIGEHPASLDAATWLPASIPAADHPSPRVHTARLDADTLVVATPEPAPTALPTGKRFALVLDRSYSMRAHATEAAAAFDQAVRALSPANEVHLYLTSAPTRGEAPRRLDDARGFDARSVVYYGGQDPAELLVQLDALRGDTAYDGILVITDEGGLDLAGEKREAKDLGAPVWMVHLGGALAPGYDDATLETIQRRGGGAVTTVDEALVKLASTGDLGWADGYRFRLDHAPEAATDTTDWRGFAAIAARRYIPGAARAPGVAGLDSAHALARKHGVVTAYSSMIVLVDEAQRQALREAEAKADRFERAVETGESKLDAPPPALGADITGTPEPEEWVLLALAALGLAWIARGKLRRGMVVALP
jgi:putative PEP-CTERM system integral membrane protein